MTTTRAPRLFAHLLLLLLGACSASGVAWEPISGEVPGLEAFRGREGFVLVWDDAPLFLDGHAAARQVRVRDLGSGERGQAVSGVVVLKLIGGREGLLEVETLGHFEPGAYCDAQPIPGLERLRLRLFVRPADVARVTTRELVLADDPASPKARLALEPGLLVAPSDDPEGRLAYVRVGPLLLRAPVPADAVGWVFKPRRHLAARDEDRALAPDAVLRLPEGASARRVWSGSSADTRQLLGPARATPWTAPTYVSAVKRHRDGALATVRTTCAELVGVVPFDQVLRAERPAFQSRYSQRDNEALGWKALMPQLDAAVQMSSFSSFVVGFILFAVVSLGIMNTLFMSLYERMFEFGVLRAIGTRPVRIGLMILFEAGALSIISIALGLCIGMSITWYYSVQGIDYVGIEFAGVTFRDLIYPVLDTRQFTLFPIGVFFFTLVAGLYPAIYAARLTPARAMQTMA